VIHVDDGRGTGQTRSLHCEVRSIDAGDRSGVSVSSAGDVNGDGIDALIIGAYSADPGGNGFAGESYVVFGGVGVGATGSINLASLDGPD